MVGSGEMEPRLRAMARDLGLTNICFTGFVNQSALPRYYGACDIFVLPSTTSRGGWRSTRRCAPRCRSSPPSEIGCVPDLVRDGRNGRIFPAGNITALADALRPLIADAALRERMGQASRDIISRWSYAECEAGLSAALAAVGRRRARVRAWAGEIPAGGGAMTRSADASQTEDAAARPGGGLAIVGAFDGDAYRGEPRTRRRAATDRRNAVRHGRCDARQPAAARRSVASRRAPAARVSMRFRPRWSRAAAAARPALLIATGAAPLTRSALRRLRGDGHCLFQLLDRRSLEQDDAGVLAFAGPAGIRRRVYDPIGESRLLPEVSALPTCIICRSAMTTNCFRDRRSRAARRATTCCSSAAPIATVSRSSRNS